MKNSRRLAESYGYKVTFFEGGNIRVEGGSVRGVVNTKSKTVMVRTDHSDLTALQIMCWEMANDIAADVVENATAITPRKPTIAVIPRRQCLRGMIHIFLFGLCF